MNNIKEYEENIEECVGNMKKYVTLGIRRAKRGANRHIFISFCLCKYPGTRKHSELSRHISFGPI